MGIFDQVAGQVLGQVAGQALGNGSQAQQLVGPLLQMLGGGGLGNLVTQLTQGGLGNVVQSWISTGQNLPVSGEQLGQALGPDITGQLAQQVGLNGADLHGALAQVLPGLVDHLTPSGQLPQPGAAMPDLGSVLGKMFGG